MSNNLCVRLPFLGVRTSHPYIASDNIKYLCPGLNTGNQQYSMQINWPLSFEQAAGIFKDFQQMSVHDLSTLCHSAEFNQNAQAIQYRNEWDELKQAGNFDFEKGNANNSKARELTLIQAQKMLIWCLHRENILHEIQSLEKQCQQQANRLLSAFSDENLPQNVCREECFLPGWKACVLNALLFLSEETAILAEGAMAEDLLDLLDFAPDNILAKTYGFKATEDYALYCAKESPDAIFGSAICSRLKRLGFKNNLKKRLWLVWKNV